MRFFLDTHMIVYYLSNDKRMPVDVKDSIEYYDDIYYTSTVVILEIVSLMNSGKVRLSMDIEQIINLLEEKNIRIIPLSMAHFKALEKLPVLDKVYNEKTGKYDKHLDPFDRAIIATAIADKLTMLSFDRKFVYYKPFGLKLANLLK